MSNNLSNKIIELESKFSILITKFNVLKKLNKEYSIYGRMLLETIKNGINLKCDEIVFGRTANEYKSNFGAIPKKSFIYLRTKGEISNYFMTFLFKKLKKQDWKQRNPFKINNSNA